ncbi:peptidase MA family metallohydrolase [Pyxidicoccus trucidator]|uniref:peptidase MA family metallohydrolase n=1 Tax=Pyxidicoccus trucidator TaxID=2709662 RepID=UPI0013DA2B68|nr:tetratricopeptide repeat protein [Pyxidicoccus trucidator]
MSALLVAILLAAAPPPSAQKAKELAASRSWEELYLAFASGEVTGVPDAQRRTISGALLKGCEALLEEDAVMAYSLGERAVAFEESAGALKCLARSARKTDQRAAAEAALRKGLERHPKEGTFGLELGRLLLEEQDAAGALAVLEKVPPRSREAAEAKRLLQQARAKTNEEGEARKEAERLERMMNGKTGRRPSGTALETAPAVGRADDSGATRPVSLAYESSTDRSGMRTRSNGRFTIRYFNNERDFGQRAEYEGRVVSALDEAYDFTRTQIGETRERPVDVVLYTREEFRMHFGATKARLVAGLYSDDAIRLNDAAELTQETKATLVHEYVHAVLDEYSRGARDSLPIWLNEGLAEYVEWRYLGREDSPHRTLRNTLAGAAKAGTLPRLADLASQALLATRNPDIAYATSATAVRELLRRGGADRFITFVKQVGGGKPIEEALRDHYGETLATLDEDVREALQ